MGKAPPSEYAGIPVSLGARVVLAPSYALSFRYIIYYINIEYCIFFLNPSILWFYIRPGTYIYYI